MLGPLLVRAVDQAALTGALDDAGLAGTSLTASFDVEAGAPYEDARTTVLEALWPAAPATVPRSGGRPEIVIRSTTIVIWRVPGSTVGTNAQVNAIDDGWDAYLITDGACPTGKSQVMISSGGVIP